MWLRHVWLTDFRNHVSAELELPAGLTVVSGANGQGKTNLLEGIGYLATLSSFRGVPAEAMVRYGAARAVVRGELNRDGRSVLVEVEILPSGRGRVAVNRQPLRRTTDLVDALRVTVFSPDDLALVKDGPHGRRRYLDELGAALHPRHDALRRDYERVLRQRTTLLRQSGGRLTDDIAITLDVWDSRLVTTGEALGVARAELVARLGPALAKAYADVAATQADHGVRATQADHGVQATQAGLAVEYQASWQREGMAAALAAARADELRRGVSLVGPHRDELELSVAGMPARTHASQGEQRSVALALRLASHHLVTEVAGEAPVLLLDDVFSELDDARADALLAHLPPGQAVLTTTGVVPAGADVDRHVRLTAGSIETTAEPLTG